MITPLAGSSSSQNVLRGTRRNNGLAHNDKHEHLIILTSKNDNKIFNSRSVGDNSNAVRILLKKAKIIWQITSPKLGSSFISLLLNALNIKKKTKEQSDNKPKANSET